MFIEKMTQFFKSSFGAGFKLFLKLMISNNACTSLYLTNEISKQFQRNRFLTLPWKTRLWTGMANFRAFIICLPTKPMENPAGSLPHMPSGPLKTTIMSGLLEN